MINSDELYQLQNKLSIVFDRIGVMQEISDNLIANELTSQEEDQLNFLIEKFESYITMLQENSEELNLDCFDQRLLIRLGNYFYNKDNLDRALELFEISNAIEYVKKYPNLYICFVSCFSCGPDGTMYHHFRQQLEGHTFCYLEIDSHTAHAGFETRVGAFLDIIEERNRKKYKTIKNPFNQSITV